MVISLLEMDPGGGEKNQKKYSAVTRINTMVRKKEEKKRRSKRFNCLLEYTATNLW